MNTPPTSVLTETNTIEEIAKIWDWLELPDRILVIDTETTGIDSKTNRVLELGMAWVTIEGVKSVYDSFFAYNGTIPPEITRLTGITKKMLTGKPQYHDAIEEISEIWGEAMALLGHNLSFDVGFLTMEARRAGKRWPLPLYTLDTRNFARLVYPEAPPGGLSGYTKWLEVSHEHPHRALSDAIATGELFRKLLPRLQLLSREECDQLAALSRASRYGFPAIMWQRLRTHLPEQKLRILPPSPWPSAVRVTTGEQSIAFPTAAEELAEGGFASRQMNAFVQRNAQIEYAHRTGEALQNQRWELLEAGTGVGKTFGYLVPVMAWLAEDHTRRAVISTYSKTLQHQLFHKDIPFWQDQFQGVEAILLKGRSNYLCPHRFTDFIGRVDNGTNPNEAYSAVTLPLWLNWTETGDSAELVTLRESSALMKKLVSDPYLCGARGCPNNTDDCFFAKVRRRAATAQLVIVNHALLCNYLFHQQQLLGEVGALIIDEAHRLEEVARDAATVELTRAIVVGMAEFFLESIAKGGANQSYSTFSELQLELSRLDTAWTNLVQGLMPRFVENAESEYGRRVRYLDGDGPAVWMKREARAIDVQFEAIIQAISRAKEQTKDDEEMKMQVESFAMRFEEVKSSWQRIRTAQENFATWWEMPAQSDPMDVTFHSAPVDVAPPLFEALFESGRFGVMTSATLTVADSFSYFRHAIGALRDDVPVDEAIFTSPFDLKRQLKIAVPMFGDDPWHGNFLNVVEVAGWLAPTLLATNVNTLILATSKKTGTAFAQALQPLFDRHNRVVWLQGRDGNPAELVELFRTHTGGVLIGYDSFWEGVDLPGATLELIIIPRLPFPVPDEPIQAAKAELVTKNGGNDFYAVSLPQTILKMKQGIGRMIRQEEDRGIVMILDRRIMTARYGTQIRKSFPVETTPLRTKQEWINLLSWLNPVELS